uniref:Ovule protein n=1 Tax=Ascaris lumbricoides TaxID=6252 RepID=A0A0M3IQV5_ASCLU
TRCCTCSIRSNALTKSIPNHAVKFKDNTNITQDLSRKLLKNDKYSS